MVRIEQFALLVEVHFEMFGCLLKIERLDCCGRMLSDFWRDFFEEKLFEDIVESDVVDEVLDVRRELSRSATVSSDAIEDSLDFLLLCSPVGVSEVVEKKGPLSCSVAL